MPVSDPSPAQPLSGAPPTPPPQGGESHKKHGVSPVKPLGGGVLAGTAAGAITGALTTSDSFVQSAKANVQETREVAVKLSEDVLKSKRFWNGIKGGATGAVLGLMAGTGFLVLLNKMRGSRDPGNA
jgi:hypothetical protein